MTRVLIAGIGNIFQGDDGFGVAVAQYLAARALPPAVRVVDFGIRGLDLVYALLDGCDAAILVDTVARGAMPGTIHLIEPEIIDLEPPSEESEGAMIALSPHAMNPQNVLRLAALLGSACRRVLLVGCEPESFGDGESGAMGLSPAVAAAVPLAAETAERLALDLALNPARELAEPANA